MGVTCKEIKDMKRVSKSFDEFQKNGGWGDERNFLHNIMMDITKYTIMCECTRRNENGDMVHAQR